MALKGTLKDFGLSDIFQLIAHQRKTGVLHLGDRGKDVAVTFDQGKVVAAEPRTDKTREKEKVGEILVKSGILNTEQLARALEVQNHTMKKLGIVLSEQKLITPELFGEVLSFQVRETLFKVFQWTSGHYRFETGKVSYDHQFVTPLSAEFILMEAARIIDEWPGVKKKIPSMEGIFLQIPGAGDKIIRKSQIEGHDEDDIDIDIFGESDAPKAFDEDAIVLSAAQEKVFDRIDGKRTAGELSYQTLMGDFEVSKTLVALMGFGLIKPISVPTATPKEEAVKERVERGRNVFVMAATLAALGAILMLSFYALGLTGTRFLAFSQVTWEKADTVRRSVATVQKRRLELAMEVYRMEKGSYPTVIDDLFRGEFILFSDITYPYARPFRIKKNDMGTVIVDPGE
ncbi:MAG: DUF4388 domain-containing protein [bacterium]